ncbi:nitrate reductase [Aquabacterium sp. OR-4]|uniref:nitrate reductase n=1 Tax=Aquabacterium sp. OR-4 TaxID=2978127 RepID=UPI0021B445E2|nr:nitrate reductase [Aquabacterium sp. OR-4]MDT7836141.1 molybdopterin-dependent oxidoreductase [Aquabacterium sp. OR-4]
MSSNHSTRSTCPYCGVGCGVIIERQGAQITGVRGDPEHPANFGRLCSKGSTLHLTASPAVQQQARLLQPMQRLSRDAAPQPSDWDTATGAIAQQLAQIVDTHGADAIGIYVSGQLLTEDYYVFNKLAKGLLGTNNIDTNSRLCMSSAVAGYKATLGADAPPACYDDLALADTVFVAGANPAWAHPILFRRLEDARQARPQQKLIVVDPRRTDTAAAADLHLQILPGSDIALFHGLLHLMLREGWTDARHIAEHTSGFAALQARVQGFTPDETARLTGVSPADLATAARWFASAGRTLSLYCQGLNQSSSGTAKNAALINLHLASGQIGKPGAGPFSLTGQPNAMGGREVGGLANLLSAHRDLADPQHRAEVAALWGVPAVPATPGKSAVEMFEAAADGRIKALWIACTNPAQSMPDLNLVRRALARAELVIVQEAFATTATARHADWLLPATTWGEKDGTVTNSERRISRVQPAVPAPGQARHDWVIARDIALALEARLRPGQPSLFNYPTPERVWCEHRESTRGRDLDITGLSYAVLEQQGPQQWPMPEGATQGRARLYEDHRYATPDGRARFFDTPFVPLAEPPDAQYPISLTTGRLRDQWHGMSRTGTLGRLFGHAPEPVVDLHPQDMARLALQPGDLVALRSRRGRLLLPAQASDTVAPGQAHVAMHWGDEVLGGSSDGGAAMAGINGLTSSAFCPRSKQPELKHTAVAIERQELPWRLLAAAWLDEARALQLRQQLTAWLPRFAFASVVPFGHGGHGVQLRAAAQAAPAPEQLAELEALFGLGADCPDALRYEDRQRGQRRAMALRRDGDDQRLQAFVLAGQLSSQTWVRALLHEQMPVQAYGRLLLSPSATPPVAMAARGAQVCTCLNISEPQIVQVLGRCEGAPAARLAQLQGALRCGTQCGSCVPQLKRLVATTPVQASATA